MKQVHCIALTATQCRLSVEVEIGIAPTEENKKTKRKEKRGPWWGGVVGKLNKLAWPLTSTRGNPPCLVSPIITSILLAK